MLPRLQCSDRQTRMTIMPRRHHDQLNPLIRKEIFRLVIHMCIGKVVLCGRPRFAVHGSGGVALEEGVGGEVGGGEDEGEVKGAGGVAAMEVEDRRRKERVRRG